MEFKVNQMQRKTTFSSSPKKTKKGGKPSKPVDLEKQARLNHLFN